MKINSQNQLGLNFTQDLKDRFYALHSKGTLDKYPDDVSAPYREQWKRLLSDDSNRNLLFTKTAIEICEKIKVDKFRPSVLKIDTTKKLTFLLGANSFYRVYLVNREVFVMHVQKSISKDGAERISYSAFKIIPDEETVVYPPNENDYLNDKNFTDFLRMLIFVLYSEVDEMVIRPNQSTGTKRNGKYVNQSKNDFVLVDSRWNNTIIRTEGFGVSGHFRLQRVGRNREERKLVYISEFVKNGYVRLSKKQTIS
jgi:hypothetical protein